MITRRDLLRGALVCPFAQCTPLTGGAGGCTEGGERQAVLDTETTGLRIEDGHRILEIGAVELLNRRISGRQFHCYLKPERDIEAAGLAVEGLTRERLMREPTFAAIAPALLQFIGAAELIIHNAPVDIGFLEREFALLYGHGTIFLRERWQVQDTLLLARERHPGQRNSLAALCHRYGIDDSHRELRGALLDARMLADVYLEMTGGSHCNVRRRDAKLVFTAARAPDPASPRGRYDHPKSRHESFATRCYLEAGRSVTRRRHGPGADT